MLHSRKQLDERPCNSFEELFCTHNIRFAVMLSFTTLIPKQHVKQVVAKACNSWPLGHYSLLLKERQWMYAHSPNSSTFDIDVVNLGSSDNKHPTGELLDRRVASSKRSASGGVHIELLCWDEKCMGVLFNVNHALCDGTALVHLAHGVQQSIFSMLDESDSNKCSVKDTATNLDHVLPRDWKYLVQDAARSLNEEPYYLPCCGHDQTMLRIQHVTPSSESSSPQVTLFHEITNVSYILQALRKDKQQKVTITGMLATCLLASLSCEYQTHDKVNKSHIVGLSIQVNLRSHQTQNNQATVNSTKQSFLPQAFGNVTVSMPCSAFVDFDDMTKSKWLEIAASVTRQLHQRIQRGEAHRSAMALLNLGNKSYQAPQEATMELSNVGLFKTGLRFPTELHTTQRFDGYDGVSCMVHSEEASDIMRWTTGVGLGINGSGVDSIMHRAMNWMQHIAHFQNASVEQNRIAREP